MPAGEVLMSVDEDRLLKEANLLAIRSIQDSIKRIDASQESMRKDVQEVREGMIRAEERDTRADVAALSVRVQNLESDRMEKKGQAGAVGWFITNWQALAMMVGVFYLIAKQAGHAP